MAVNLVIGVTAVPIIIKEKENNSLQKSSNNPPKKNWSLNKVQIRK